MSGGALEVLVAHLEHEDPVVMANSLWALMVSLLCCVRKEPGLDGGWVWFRVQQRGVAAR